MNHKESNFFLSISIWFYVRFRRRSLENNDKTERYIVKTLFLWVSQRQESMGTTLYTHMQST